MEAKLQSEIIRWLKGFGAYVIKTKPGPGVPVGCPDIIFIYEGAWGAIEVKAAPSSKYQPGQKITLQRLEEWSPFVFRVYPENWPMVRDDLLARFF